MVARAPPGDVSWRGALPPGPVPGLPPEYFQPEEAPDAARVADGPRVFVTKGHGFRPGLCLFGFGQHLTAGFGHQFVHLAADGDFVGLVAEIA